MRGDAAAGHRDMLSTLRRAIILVTAPKCPRSYSLSPASIRSRGKSGGARSRRGATFRLGETADVAYVCAWHAPRELFARLPRLQAIFSLGTGVDHVLADPGLPNVPVVRIVDPDLTMRMTEYVVLHALLHHLPCRRQPKRSRLWLADGSCIRLLPQQRPSIWSKE
jgi:phosphoglycerate dehydrogenase-like enzyme